MTPGSDTYACRSNTIAKRSFATHSYPFALPLGSITTDLSTFIIPDGLFPLSPSRADPGVRIINYDSKADEIVRSKIILQQHLFSLLLEGHKSVHTASKHLHIDNSRFLLLTSGHYLMTEKTVSPQGNYRSILLFFTQQTISNFFARYPGIIATSAGKDNTAEQVEVFDKDEFLYGFIQSLQLISQNTEYIPAELQQVKLQELLIYLCHRYPQKMNSLQAIASRESIDTEIKQLAENHIESNISVEELAFLSNMSISTFKRKFIKIYGVPPGKWFLQKRMEHAATLLRMGNSKPADVYYKVGYENHSSFTHSFKQVFGITPSEYCSKTY